MPSLHNGAILERPRPVIMAPPPVRVATAADRPAIMALLRLQHAEAPIAVVNWPKVAETVGLLCPDEKPKKAFGLVALAIDGGKVVGCVGLVFASLWWTDDLHLDERFFFVHPDHRKSRHAQRLVDWCKGVQKRFAIPLVSCVFSTKDTERKVAFFQRNYPMVGAVFRYTGD